MRATRTISISVAALLWACGGGTQSTTADEQIEGVPDNPPEESQQEVEVQRAPAVDEPAPAGPVQVTVTARVGSDDVQAAVTLVNEAGETVAEGLSGEPFTVESGYYQVSASISDADVLIDTPTKTQEAQLSPGEPQTVEVTFHRARVQLNVSRNGRPVRNAEVRLFRQGSDEASVTYRPGSTHVPITPGRYEADVVLRGQEIRVRGLTFMDGATQVIPVNIQ